jgi:flagellin
MGLRINTNLASLHGQRALTLATGRLETTFRRLSTGLRVGEAADDAAGLALTERLATQTRSLDQAVRNAQDGVSVTQTAEGALQEVGQILLRMRELTTEAKNGTTSGRDRDSLDEEFQQLLVEIDRIARSTTFNGVALLDGSATSIPFQVGIGGTANVDTIALALQGTLATTLGLATLDIGSAGDFTLALTRLDGAIDAVASFRGRFGAVQNRLQATIANLRVQAESLTASASRIRDADVAVETAALARDQVMQQSAIAVLTQANAHPRAALDLLRV